VLLLAGILGVVAVTFVLVRRLYHGRVRRTVPWDCGDPWQTPRMQDTAEGFGQPIRHIFGSAFRIERELPSPWDSAPRYRVHIEDRLWHALYVPLGRGVQRLAGAVAVIQGGRLAIYLLYAFLTLLALLVFVL
jgi:hydrogenase-4 component B